MCVWVGGWVGGWVRGYFCIYHIFGTIFELKSGGGGFSFPGLRYVGSSKELNQWFFINKKVLLKYCFTVWLFSLSFSRSSFYNSFFLQFILSTIHYFDNAGPDVDTASGDMHHSLDAFLELENILCVNALDINQTEKGGFLFQVLHWCMLYFLARLSVSYNKGVLGEHV